MIIFLFALTVFGHAAAKWNYTVTVKTAAIESPGSELNLTVKMTGKGGNSVTHVLRREGAKVQLARRQDRECSWGSAMTSTGLSGNVLRQYTTKSYSNPQWMNGNTFAENVALCKEDCESRADCKGLQFSPTSWNHQECFLMDGEDTYTRSSWKTQLMTCEESEDLSVGASASWCEYADSFLYSYSSGTSSYDELADAQEACLERDDCGGITQEPYNSDRYTLRVGPELHDWSPTAETSWVVCDEDNTPNVGAGDNSGEQCRQEATDFLGGDISPYRQDLFTEEECVEFCRDLEGCMTVTLVGSNSQYDSSLEGCYPKAASGFTVDTSTRSSNMTSVDVECLRSLTEFDGDLSGSDDDDTSVVTCEEGSVVTHCDVKSGGVGDTSDGAHVSTDGSTCTAVNSGRGDGVVAHARCSQNSTTEDGRAEYVYLQDKGTSASVECPDGYSAHFCSVHSPWVNNLDDENFNDAGVASDPSQCQIDDCTNWCRVSLICKADALEPERPDLGRGSIVEVGVDIVGEDGFTSGSLDIFSFEDDVDLGTLKYVEISSGSDNAWQLDWLKVETDRHNNEHTIRVVYNTETKWLSTDPSDASNDSAVDLLELEVQGTETYYLVIETANKTAAGSDNIHLKAIIHGTDDTYTGYLDNPGEDDFVIGENDVFIVPGMAPAGRLQCLTLLCWGDDEWEFDWIVVFSVKSYSQPPRVFWNNATVLSTDPSEGVTEYNVCRNDNQYGSVELV